MRIKRRHSSTTFLKKAGRCRNLGKAGRVSPSPPAFAAAKVELPIFYTENDFVLSRLRNRGALTISGSVTTRERVGRSMRPHESACSDIGGHDAHELESRVRQDLPIPRPRPFGRRHPPR